MSTVALLAIAARAPAAGLVAVEQLENGVGGIDGLGGAARVAITPDGANVYVTAGQESTLAVLGRDAATGRLKPVEVERWADGIAALFHASPLAVSPDGAHVYAGGYDANALAVFQRDPATGRLTLLQTLQQGVDGVDGLSNDQGLGMSPDGTSLYVASYEVAVFRGDPATGLLTFVETKEDGVDGVTGLFNPAAATVSPDGANVYIPCTTNGDAVVVFRRDATTGALTFVEVQKEGVNGVDGIRGASSVALDAAGQHVYVAGFGDNAVALFDRDSGTGSLTFVEVVRNGVGGVTGLQGADTVTVSPDGAYVYVGAYGGSAATMFRRDDTTGHLTFVQGTALDRDGAIVTSPDGRHLYVSSYQNAVDVFRPFTLACSPTPAAGCRPAASRQSSFSLRNEMLDGGDRLVWRWSGGPFNAGDFGDPAADTDYALCVYDAAATPQPVAVHIVPADAGCGAGTCWRGSGAAAFKYLNRAATPDGFAKITLQQHSPDAAKIVIKGTGPNLHLPARQLELPVTVQLQRAGAGPCWEATYPTASSDDLARFRATTP